MDLRLFKYILCLLIINVHGNSVVEDILHLELNTDLIVSLECRSVLRKIQEGLTNEEVWVVKLLDASGRIESNFVAGNNFWLGSRPSCHNLNDPVSLQDMNLSKRYTRYSHENLTLITAPFEVKYYVTYVEHQSKYQLDHEMFKENILHIGSCLPKSCSNEDVTELVSEVLDENFEKYKIIGKNYSVTYTKTVETSSDFMKKWFVITLIGVSSISLFLIIFGIMFHRKVIDSLDTPRTFPSLVQRIFECFSVNENLQNIFKLESSEEDPLKAVIHGIRAFSTIYVILAHVGYFSLYIMDNTRELLRHTSDFIVYPFINSPMVIDNFFAMSGFCLGLGVLTAKKHKISLLRIIGGGILSRYIRLIIPYIPALLIFMTIAAYFEHASPFLTFIRDNDNCQNYWWRNWLFINNLYHLEEQCYVTTWYFAADLQLFAVFITILAIWTKYPKIGTSLLQIGFITGVVIAGYVGYFYDYSFYIDVQLRKLNTTYFASWARIGSYLFGIGGALIYHKLKQVKLELNNCLMFFLHTVVMTLAGILYFGPIWSRQDNALFGALYLSLGRIMWSFTVVWCIVATGLGHPGLLGRLFKQEWLIPISRISYSTCLMNQIVLHTFLMLADKPYHYDLPMAILNFIGFLIITLITSVIFNLIFEFPFVRLVKLLEQNSDSK